MNCHKCQYNNKCSDKCLECTIKESYSYPYQHYIADGYEPKQPDIEQSAQCTTLSEDDEDKLRKALYDMFDLQPLELLLLQSIMKHQTLNQFADSMTALLNRQHKMMAANIEHKFTRHHAFQLRKSLLNKIPRFKDALLTEGQRKELKP